MSKSIVAALSIAIVLGLIPAAFAKGPVKAATCTPALLTKTTPEDRAVVAQARYFDGSYNLGVLKKRLRLSEQQKQEMRLLYTGFEDRTRNARTSLLSLVNEKKDILRSGNIDEKKLAELDDQIVKLRSDMYRERLKLVRDRLALLTPVQTKRLAHLRERNVCHTCAVRIRHKTVRG